jgi:hypothetical protein
VDATDDELLAFIDGWAALLEREDYTAAFGYTDHIPEMGWTADLIRRVIAAYGDARPGQRVTVAGTPTDITQTKAVDRWPANRWGFCGEIWYDLNIDGVVSDLTATFRLRETPTGLVVCLNDIHVM